jgi:hypothetical protein
VAFALGGVFLLGSWAVPAAAQVTPPDLTVCDSFNTCEAPAAVCKAGFRVTLNGFTAPAPSDSGTATYVYEVCSPPEGVCVGGNFDGNSCSENEFCQRAQGPNPADPTASCNRDCAVDDFKDLSHFDVPLTEIEGTCIGESTEVTVQCTNGVPAYSDASCDFDAQALVAKCDETDLAHGECLTMTVEIAGELTGLGLANALVVDKEGNTCTSACIQGPSCEPCDGDGEGDECLTRTRGFWGTHPHIADDFLDITVCGVPQTTTDAGVCGTSEALCYNNSDRRPANPQSLELVAQLTAAKLNLNATLDIFGTTCDDFEYDGMTIQEWIDDCEADFCDASKKAISESGCIEALDAFNNSPDTGLDQTPKPFDHPGPAQVGECQKARGNGISNYTCSQP